MNSGKGGDVIRGRFKPRHQASTIRRRNNNALASRNRAEPEYTPAALGPVEGHVFRATEIWARTSNADRASADKSLVRMIAEGSTIEEIAWEFVTGDDECPHGACSVTEAAKARAFLILAYGESAAH